MFHYEAAIFYTTAAKPKGGLCVLMSMSVKLYVHIPTHIRWRCLFIIMMNIKATNDLEIHPSEASPPLARIYNSSDSNSYV